MLRLYPFTLHLVPHKSSCDCKLSSGHVIEHETMVLVDVYSMQRDLLDMCEDSEKFVPKRFVGTKKDGNNRWMMSFGMGRHKCPIESLALRTVGIELGILIQCFKWKRIGVEEVDMSEGQVTGDGGYESSGSGIDLGEQRCLVSKTGKPGSSLPFLLLNRDRQASELHCGDDVVMWSGWACHETQRRTRSEIRELALSMEKKMGDGGSPRKMPRFGRLASRLASQTGSTAGGEAPKLIRRLSLT
ncbi:hypothetical protein PR202_ga12045 [Eleusine coracana subsp. coracana]|uniref:Cytochrome P450 n=1 Tax=Eleusine coracana subsp. coracana TaxID=191504 RepID=A0AAV5CAZ8_ELECO|nr:hypothetical protein PR202_ga12045 [Eleusine coracana subsp. coracana]